MTPRFRVRNALTLVSGVIGLVATASCSSTSGPQGDDVGVARLSLSAVPADLQCLEVLASGQRSVTKRFSLLAGSSVTLEMAGLPLGIVQFSGTAFAASCASTSGSPPTWISDPVSATLVSGVVAVVQLVMRRNGRASIGIVFEDEDGGADAAAGAGGGPADGAAGTGGDSPDGAAGTGGTGAAGTGGAGGTPDGGMAGQGGGTSICAQPTTDYVWATITAANNPTWVRAIAPEEVWGTSVRKLQRWNGTGWSEVAVPFTWTKDIGVVHGSGSNDVWVTNGGTSVARWDGAVWTDRSPASLPAEARIVELRALGGGVAWAISNVLTPPDDYNNQYTASTVLRFDGSNWTVVAATVDPQSIVSLYHLWGTGPNDVWVTGELTIPRASGDGLLLHWDGTTLERRIYGPFGNGREFINGGWASSPSDVWVAGGSSIGAKLSHFDGSTWTEVRLPDGQGSFGDVWGWCSTSVWAVSNGGVWHFDGASWTRVSAKLNFFDHVSGTSSDDVWVSGPTILRLQANTCGDQAIGPGEECDPPRANASPSNPVCDQTCHIPTCGNLVLDPGEACDPPNGSSCDGQCQAIVAVCGDGIVQGGEGCEFGENQICQSCHSTDCGSCFAFWGIDGHLCDGLSVADTISCNRLIGCMSGGIGACALGSGGIGCFCSDLSCSKGANGPCADEMRSLSHTSSNDPAEVLAAIRSGAVGRVVNAYYTFTTTGTGCYRHCPPN